jgi:uncharacterized protein
METEMELRIERQQKEQTINALREGKILLVQGPKGLGKTSFVLEAIETITPLYQLLEKTDYRDLNTGENLKQQLMTYGQGSQYLILKNAEYLQHLQAILELALSDDELPRIVLICSFQPHIDELLLEALQEADLIIELSPFSFYELAQVKGMGTLEKELGERLVFGSYPAVIDNPEEAESILNDLVDNVLVAQLGSNDRINKKKELIAVLKILAFDMGEIISYNDIGLRCDLDNETVERYIELFEKAKLLLRIHSYYGGKKYEMKKGVSVYFLDNGIRNALINNFNSMEWRNDATQLWRNWLFIEKIKWNRNLGKKVQYFTWRTHTKQNVDCIEIENGRMRAYQTSWTKKKIIRFPAGFTKNYPLSETFQLNRSTYWSFLSSKK